MNCVDENDKRIDYKNIESREQRDANEFIKPDDKVLELGARYGGVSITINKILNDKKNHVAVEPDDKVWNALELNRDNNDCEFQICKGAISNKPLKINDGGYNGFGNFTSSPSQDENGDIPLFKISDFNIDFNVLVADCEGALENFYNENKDFFKNLRLIIYERDGKECNYHYLEDEFNKLGFTVSKDSGSHVVIVK